MTFAGRYQLLFENSKASVFITTPEGRYVDINPAGLELFGYASREEMLSLNVATDIFADASGRKAYFQKLEKDGYVKDFKLELKRKDGERITVLVTASAVRDNSGNTIAYQGIHRDITEREQKSEALREDLERLDLALQSANLGVWHLDIIKNRRDFDEQAFLLLGLDPETFTGTHEEYLRVVHPDDHDKIKTALERSIEHNVPYASEYRVIWPDGSIHYIAGRGKIVRDEAGRAVKMHGIHWDITENKKAEEARAESEERFRRLIQNSNDIIDLLDEKGVQKHISGPSERVLGYKPEELAGKSASEFIHSDDLESVKKMFTELVQQPGAVRTVEYRHQHKNGKWISLEAVGSNLLHDPIVKAVVVNIRDISERNRLQEQLQQALKMEAIGRLAGGVAHDFNNILTVISGNVDLARIALNRADPLIRYLDNAMKASDSAASLTLQLLAFSRKQIIEPKILNLNDLVLNVRQMLVRLIGENIELNISLAREELGSVRIDPGQFEQVLVNLAVNARDAMPQGGKLVIETANITLDEIYCSDHAQAQPGNFVMLAVSDTGHGMSEDVKEHIFEPFFTTKNVGHGTGLGLATIFGIVKQSSGTIEVYSEVGNGTTFRICLPLVEKRAEKLTKERLPVDILKGSETIMFVEDNSSVRQVGAMILNDLGYKTIEARNGDEALMLAERHTGQIHLLMTDIIMPGINGRELSERLTKLYPDMKILFTSGYTENIIVHHGILDSSLNFIGKPYSLQPLASKIREVLGPLK